MAQTKEKMICPCRGAAMNHHEEKLVEPTSPEEAKRADPALGGIIEEVHTCPKCGTSASCRGSGLNS